MQGKSLLAIAFGVGRIPKGLASELQAEGVVVSDDGVPMSLHFVKYRSPRNGFTGRKGLAGYIALTSQRLVAKGYWETTELPLSRLNRENISYGMRAGNVFWLAIEASDFYDDRSGRIEHRFTTPHARQFKRELDRVLGIDSTDENEAVYSRKDALFYCKRDAWATVMVWGIAAMAAASVFVVNELNPSVTSRMLAVFGAFLVGGIGIYFWGTTYYRLASTHLHLHSGMFHSSIPLETITSIKPARWTAGMSYAWSLDTLQIESTRSRSGYLISPDDPAGFVTVLRARAPNMR